MEVNLLELLPLFYTTAGQHAGYLNEAGALLLDPSGSLHAGIPLCPPEGDAGTGMVLANNCSSDINAWLGLFREFHEAMGLKTDLNQLFSVLFNKPLEADADGGGLLSYGYYSGENTTGLLKGRPLFVLQKAASI